MHRGLQYVAIIKNSNIMTQSINTTRGEDPLREMKAFGAQWMAFFGNVHQMMAENEELRRQVASLEQENERLKEAMEQTKRDDEWSGRVTYDNVVDQIAACEDAKERDEARKLFEPLLKKNMVSHFRKDIKKRVKELNEDSGSTFNNYGSYTEIHSGGININN